MKQIRLLVAVLAFWNCVGIVWAEAQQAKEGGASLSNASLRVVAAPGQPEVAVHFKSAGVDRRVVLAIQASDTGRSAPVSKAEVGDDEAGEGVLRLTMGTAHAEITLGPGVFLKIKPGHNAASVEVRADARYVALPDFFADDVVFDPVKLTMSRLTIPAENFLLQFIEGGDAMVMCIWPGNLKLPATRGTAASAPKIAKDGPDPQVDLVFAGQGRSRRVGATRIEFQNKPVYVGILEHKGIWHDEDVRGFSGYKPTPIAWKRPFEARWRGDFIVAEGKSMKDWPARNQSFEFQNTSNPRADRWWERGTDAMDARFAAATSNVNPKKWWEQGDENAPQIWQESLASFFIYPAVFKGDEVRLCLYVDREDRNKAPNVYDHVIIYPLGRNPATPLTVYTPVDLMRETLGTGPCEYVLDLAGVKPQPAGGDRPILSYATCGLWNDHIAPITKTFRKTPGGVFQRLDEKTMAHLIQALEEMWYFVHAVHDRLREYKKWGADMSAYCEQESAKNPTVKAVADRAMPYIKRLNADIARHRFEGAGSEAYWKGRIPEIIATVKEGKYAEVAGVGKIRDLGNDQDERVSRCRQYVKALRQEVLLQDTSDPDARKFATEVRDRCHQMLRNMHPKEGF
ncbi:MAG: hypothetical protein ACLQNE_00185 [Thermoguttaceae bacterium]